MEVKDTLLVILLCVGALQGIIYGSILWRNQGRHRLANRFLAAILFFFSYRLIVETLKIFGLGRYDTWYHILLEYNWVYGPLIFFFALSYVTPNFRLKPKHWIHFLPVAIEVIWSFFIKSQNFYWDGTRESLSWLGYWGYVVWMQLPTMYVVSSLLIIFYSTKAIKAINAAILNPSTRVIPKKLQWIKRVIYVLIGFSVVYLAGILIDYFFFDFSGNLFYGHPVFIGMAAITYWLGLEGFARRNDSAFLAQANVSPKELEQLTLIANKLDDAMVKKELYKEATLNLEMLSNAIDVKPYLVTKALSVVKQNKFGDYVNNYRIEALKNLLKDTKNKQYTLLSLAFEAGFNSKASFNRAVKKITGKSPKDLKSDS
ncbi:MAG: helix-turn-helix domain-containing protein [Gilvibacter sp.]